MFRTRGIVVLFVAGFVSVLGFVTAASSVLSLSMLLRDRARIIAKMLKTTKALGLTAYHPRCPRSPMRLVGVYTGHVLNGEKSAPSGASQVLA
jgi:hypothetical protein